MVRVGLKRKAPASGLEQSTKKLRLEELQHDRDVQDDDAASDYSDRDSENESEDDGGRTADTPITPFSPSRVMFPSQRKTIPCTFEGCNKLFNRPARLVSHMRSHTNEKPFVCSYEGCDKAYAESKHLKQHVKGTHTQEREYACDWEGCNKTFLTGTRLRRHQEAHKGHDRFRCSEYPPCNQTFRKHQTLQRHIRADHMNLTPFPCVHINPETSIKCGAGFDSGGALRKHEDRVHGALRFFCEDCTTPGPTIDSPLRPLGFRTKVELKKHIKTNHLDCLFCDMTFKSQADLEDHTETAHSEPGGLVAAPKFVTKPICTWEGCGKTFAKKSNLDVHIRQVHKGERYTCGGVDLTGSSIAQGWDGLGACGREFIAKVSLEDHVRTQHMGLPSVVNAKRLKGRKEPKIEEEALNYDPVALLTGVAYSEQNGRNIPCSIPGCNWLFMRQYDMEQHIRSKHTEIEPISAPDNSIDSAMDSVFDPSALGITYNPTLDLEWQIQQQAAQGDEFWFGSAGDQAIGAFDSGLNEWTMDEQEMRKLIDENGQVSGADDLAFDSFVDPALNGM